jgi:hypothetical protein
MNSSSLKRSIPVLLTVIVLWVLVSRSADLSANVSKRDFIAYWAAGQLLIQHQNPYERGAVLDLERQQGFTERNALILRTPPWSLFMMLPLGLINAYWGWVFWIAISIASLVIAMRLCWNMFGHDAGLRSIFVLAGYTFAPVLGCLVAAQLGILLLLGIVLFLRFESDRSFLAGAALILTFSKPHILSLFWLAFLFWVLGRKKWRVAAGFSAALLTATAVAVGLDPAVFRHYREMLHTASIGCEFIPALAGVLRLIFFRRAYWTQFVPMIIGAIWCVWYYFANRSNWAWRHHGAMVMVASVLTTPYGWFTDEVVLLPAILHAALCAYSHPKRTIVKISVAVMFACLNGLLLLMVAFKVPLASGMYCWSSLLWFIFTVYGYSRKKVQPVSTVGEKQKIRRSGLGEATGYIDDAEAQ